MIILAVAIMECASRAHAFAGRTAPQALAATWFGRAGVAHVAGVCLLGPSRIVTPYSGLCARAPRGSFVSSLRACAAGARHDSACTLPIHAACGWCKETTNGDDDERSNRKYQRCDSPVRADIRMAMAYTLSACGWLRDEHDRASPALRVASHVRLGAP